MHTSLRVTGVLPGLESSVVVLGLSLWLLAEATDVNRKQTIIVTKRSQTQSPLILTVRTVGSPKPLQHNHPGESATRAMTTHPDSRQGRPMAAPVGLSLDSGSLRASHDSELSARFVNIPCSRVPRQGSAYSKPRAFDSAATQERHAVIDYRRREAYIAAGELEDAA